MNRSFVLLAIFAAYACLVSCSGNDEPTTPNDDPPTQTDPTTQILLTEDDTSSWAILSGTYNLKYVINPFTGIWRNEQRPIEWMDFCTSEGTWEFIAYNVIYDGAHTRTVYLSDCEVASMPIDFSTWDSARIVFSICKVLMECLGEVPLQGPPNGSVSISLVISSNVPGVPDLLLAHHDTNDEDQTYDIPLESIMSYRAASVTAIVDSDYPRYEALKLILKDLKVYATRE